MRWGGSAFPFKYRRNSPWKPFVAPLTSGWVLISVLLHVSRGYVSLVHVSVLLVP
jgi:hypothetical protein